MKVVLPAPIDAPYAEYAAEVRPFARLHRLVDIYEAALKYVAMVAIQNFYAAGLASVFPVVDRLILDHISRPHLGDWAGFLREVLRCFADQEAALFDPNLFLFYYRKFGAKPRPQDLFVSEGSADQLLILRNNLAHGATLPDEEATGLLAKHQPHLETLLERIAFVSELPLYYVEAQGNWVKPLMGANYRGAMSFTIQAASLPVGHVVLHNPKTGMFLDLHPLLIFAECLEELTAPDGDNLPFGTKVCRQQKILYYNTLKSADRIHFLDYWRGHHSRYRASEYLLADEFRARFPALQKTEEQAEWFGEFIATWTQHFVGREAEMAHLDTFRSGSGRRVLVVVGAPGMGKSALLARWADQHNSIRHFIRQGDAATCETVRIFENLGRQLSERYNIEWKAPAQPEPSAYRQAFDRTLRAAAQQSTVVIVLDGLDEAVREVAHGRGMEAVDSIVAWLPEPAFLPAGVKLLLSTRRELLEQSAFAAKFERDKVEHLELNRMTDADVRALLFRVRSKYEVLDSQEYVQTIVGRSEGSPLYLRMLLEDLDEGRAIFGEIETLPGGLIAYFERILNFIEAEGRFRETPSMATSLKAKQETYERLVRSGDLTQERAAASIEREKRDLEVRSGGRSLELLTLYCLTHAPLSLSDAGTILQADDGVIQQAFAIIRTVIVDAGSLRFALFHTGFREFLFSLDHYIPSGHDRLREIKDHVTNRLLNWCESWQIHRHPYALRYYAEHLREAGESRTLYALARNRAFLHMQWQLLTDTAEAPGETLRAALDIAITQDQAGEMAEFALISTRWVENIQDFSPLTALREGLKPRALKLADQFEMERNIVWHLLLAWELSDTGDLAAADQILRQLQQRSYPLLADSIRWMIATILGHLFEIDSPACQTLAAQTLRSKEIGFYCGSLLEREYIEAALQAAKSAGGMVQLEVLIQAAAVWIRKKRSDAAIPLLKQAEILAAQLGDSREQDEALALIAPVLADAGQAKAAYRMVKKIDLSHSLLGEDAKSDAMARVHVRTGRLSEAEKSASQIFDRSRRAGAYADLAVVSAAARPTARRLFKMARSTAEQLRRDNVEKGDTLVSIAEAERRANLVAEARETLSYASTTLEKPMSLASFRLLGDIAVAEARFGDFTAAMSIANQAKESTREDLGEMYFDIIIARIAAQYAENGCPKQAREMISTVLIESVQGDYSNVQSRALALVAEAQASVSALDEAYVTFEKAIALASGEEKLLRHIAWAQLRCGLIDAAAATVMPLARSAQLELLVEIGNMHVRQGAWDRAHAVFRSVSELEHPQSEDRESIEGERQRAEAVHYVCALAANDHISQAVRYASTHQVRGNMEVSESIAAAQIRSGDWASAKETILGTSHGKKGDNRWHAKQLCKVAAAAAEAGDTQDAVQTFSEAIGTMELHDAYYAVPLLAHVGVVQAENGQQEAARVTMKLALDKANYLLRGPVRDEALKKIAEAQARAGLYADAVKTSDRIDASSLYGVQPNIYAFIAPAQADRGQFTDALKTATRVPEDGNRTQSKILASIACAQAEAGLCAEALQVAAKIADSDWKMESYAAIAKEKVREGRGQEALQLLDLIDYEKFHHINDFGRFLAERGDGDLFKQLLPRATPYPWVVYNFCGLLALLYPLHATAIAAFIHPTPAND